LPSISVAVECQIAPLAEPEERRTVTERLSDEFLDYFGFRLRVGGEVFQAQLVAPREGMDEYDPSDQKKTAAARLSGRPQFP
jgi:hypothetical protein